MLWMIVGLVIGVGGYWLVVTVRAQKIRVVWYDWLIGALALVLALLALQNFFGSLEELEPQAAWMLLLMFGVPALLLAGVTGFLVWRQNRVANTLAKD